MAVSQLSGELSVTAKIRYHHRSAAAVLRQGVEGIECIFEEPQRAPAPGQALVCYLGEYVAGGGTIL